jgi:hypothetical protein
MQHWQSEGKLAATSANRDWRLGGQQQHTLLSPGRAADQLLLLSSSSNSSME